MTTSLDIGPIHVESCCLRIYIIFWMIMMSLWRNLCRLRDHRHGKSDLIFYLFLMVCAAVAFGIGVAYKEGVDNASLFLLAGKHSSPKPLNIEEEQHMWVFYEQKIQEVCEAFGFPHKIQATAIIYFKRFYLQWFVMEHHPKNIMLTCVYASSKVEENHVSAKELVQSFVDDMKDLQETAKSEVDKVMLTDAPLLFPLDR
ncbi:hypothetical protein Scep_007412 [Stephania cephalantha]|uniref:Cyclin-like domain-containing protein n=1 Tax=Stephania cephalantha TaxID=152367 RepID=A0AAP0KB39_9MAGN